MSGSGQSNFLPGSGHSPLVQGVNEKHQTHAIPLGSVALFALNYLKHPKMLGSFIPSSQYLINRLLRQIEWSQAQVILEFGPGIGVITAEILNRMSPDARLIVFETNQDFVQFLHKTLHDPRLTIIHGSAGRAAEVLRELRIAQADYVVWGIPFKRVPEAVRLEILSGAKNLLGKNGALIVYQFSKTIAPFLAQRFQKVTSDFEWLNVLPAQIYYCRQPAPRPAPLSSP